MRRCQIDSISQSWSVLSGAGDPERTRMAMEVTKSVVLFIEIVK